MSILSGSFSRSSRAENEDFDRMEAGYLYLSNRQRQKAFRTNVIIFLAAFLSVPLVVVLFLAATSDYISDGWAVVHGSVSNIPILSIVAALAGVAASVSFFSYLKPKVTSQDIERKNNLRLEIALSGYEKKLSRLEGKFTGVMEKIQNGVSGEGLFSDEEKAKILSDLSSKLESEAVDEYYSRLSARIEASSKYKQLEGIFLETSSRLKAEVESQSSRGNINLFLGIITTLAGISVLGYSVLTAPDVRDGVELASHFIPRLSLVLIIEIFSYFFLRLYKQSLDEIKYFQNEITNVESRYLGLRLACEMSIEEGVANTVNQLISTERNFVLEKGQTTTQLELKRLDHEKGRNAMEQLGSIFSELTKRKN
ncbi:hypothetical protein [Ectopseudomonas khazarica]|uniref:hypothetical protein n=1 Tax=Ectopseudomonas khazarica TaxID=2502979 RepID=UPI0037C917B2